MKINQGFSMLREKLFEPAAALTNQTERHRAHLFSELMLGSFFTMGLLALVFGLGDKMPRAPFFTVLGVILGVYILGRSKYYRIGAGLVMFSLCAMSIWAIISASDYSSGSVTIILMWMIIPVLITSMIFGPRASFVFSILIFSSLLFLPLLIPALEYQFLAPAWSFMVTWAVLHMAYMFHSDKLERERLTELEQAYQELQHEIEQHKQMEERLELAIAGSGGAYWDEEFNPNLAYEEQSGILFNSAEEKALLGYDHDSDYPATMDDWTQHVLPEDQPLRAQRQRQHYDGQTEYLDHEYRVRRADGEIRWIHGRSRIIRDENGTPLRWVGIDWDVTERKLVEAELLHYRKNLEELVLERTERLNQRTRHLELLNDITNAAIGAQTFQEMLQTLADRLGELIGAEGCYITLWDEANQKAIPGAAYGPLRDSYPSFRPQPGENTLTEAVFKRKAPIVVEDAHHSPYISPNISKNFPGHSLLGLPLIANEQKLGAALIAFNQPHLFTDLEISDCQQAVAQIALTIAKNKALETESLARQRAEMLQKATRALSASLELQEIFDIILQSLREVVPYDSASVQQLRGDMLTIIGGHGFPNISDLVGVSFDLNQNDSPNVEVIQQRKTIMYDDAAQKYPTFRRSPHAEANIRSWMGVPLIARGEMIGMIALDRKQSHSFTTSDAELVEAFAVQAAISIQNARLFDETQSYANTLEEKVTDRTSELQILVNAMAGREVRMADLKVVIRKLRKQLKDEGFKPVADDPLNIPL